MDALSSKEQARPAGEHSGPELGMLKGTPGCQRMVCDGKWVRGGDWL